MQLKKYAEVGGRRVALAADPGKLPKIGNGWMEIGEIEVNADEGPRIGASSADIIAGIEKDGHYMLPGPSDA